MFKMIAYTNAYTMSLYSEVNRIATEKIFEANYKKQRKPMVKRSFCWHFMTSPTEKNLAVCKICKRPVRYYGSSTTELTKHLAKVHNVTSENYLNSSILSHADSQTHKRRHDSIGGIEEEESRSTSVSVYEIASYPEKRHSADQIRDKIQHMEFTNTSLKSV
jgi:hypothetical protein